MVQTIRKDIRGAATACNNGESVVRNVKLTTDSTFAAIIKAIEAASLTAFPDRSGVNQVFSPDEYPDALEVFTHKGKKLGEQVSSCLLWLVA